MRGSELDHPHKPAAPAEGLLGPAGLQFWGLHSSILAVLTSRLREQHSALTADLEGGTRAAAKLCAGIWEPKGENHPGS